ncbi:hypothetical protein M405DRAFT_286010 [Rhizopogon salebrosus TDB-379]|nr:hypothetical protein M405DRAFT_286010 [Rhizopogon salebrosus TDB-379]
MTTLHLSSTSRESVLPIWSSSARSRRSQPDAQASPFAGSTLNPYLSIMLTFLATITKHEMARTKTLINYQKRVSKMKRTDSEDVEALKMGFSACMYVFQDVIWSHLQETGTLSTGLRTGIFDVQPEIYNARTHSNSNVMRIGTTPLFPHMHFPPSLQPVPLHAMYHQQISEMNHIHYLLSGTRNGLASASARQVPLSSLPRFHSLPTRVLIHVP